MSSWRAFCETIHLLALSIWLGIVVCTGAAAAVVIPTVKALNPSAPGFAAYSGEHWPIVGGKIASKLFLMADTVQFACSLIAVATLLCLVFIWGLPKSRPATMLRALSLGVGLASFAGLLLVLTPAMNAALRAFWEAAEAGAGDAAALHRAAFDSNHPLASRLMGVTALGVLVALISGIWSAVKPEWRATTAGAARYEVPALARGAR